MSQDDSSPLTRDIAPFGVRMPPDLKARVAAAAKANNRSMNAEIIARLKTTFEMDAYQPGRNVHLEADVVTPEDVRELMALLVDALKKLDP